MTQRKIEYSRNSSETQIKIVLNIDGSGVTKIKTPVGFLTHMLELFAFHGCFDLELTVTGDTHIDIHHTNEDIAIALGKAFSKALGDDRVGIKRFGSAFAPMEETLGHTVVDISGRGYFKFNTSKTSVVPVAKEGYAFTYMEHFMDSFARSLGATIIVNMTNIVEDVHTNVETVFKSFGMALDQATTVDPRRVGKVPSTKGIID